MWSDRPEPTSRGEVVARLRSVLPPPSKTGRYEDAEFSCAWDARGLAELLWDDPGFLWLDRPDGALLAADPIARLTVRDGMAAVRGPCGAFEADIRGFDLVEAAMDAWSGAPGAILAGYLGYELGCELEGLPAPPRQPADPPELCLGLYDWRWERTLQGWRIRGSSAWRGAEEVAAKLRTARAHSRAQEPRHGRASSVTSTPDHVFRESVARTVARIWNGELFQVNLCRRLEARLPAAGVWPFYLRLRAASPASQGALIRTGASSAVLSVSPELFLSVRKGQVRSRPIKGTRPRGSTPEEDRAFAEELSSSEKDRAELAMIVDVTRNDLGRVCQAGSVTVTRHAELVSLPTVHHTFSEVTGILRPECGPADLLRAGFPPASITGAPKIHAMELAALEEGFRRGPCMGSIGWISLDGDMELSVAIRTAVAADDRVWYLAGCGITAESDPEAELAESQAKAAAFLRALEPEL